jgi:hypothetical protein
LTKDDYGWPSDVELDVSKLLVLPKNLAKSFMNTFFAEHRSHLTLDESVRLSTQVRWSDLHFRIDALNCPRLTMIYPCSLAVVQIGPRLQARVAARLRSRHIGVLPQASFMEEGNWIEMTGIPLITDEGTVADGGADADAEGGCAETGHGADHEAEGGTEQGAETTHDDRAERTGPTEESPANDAKRAVGVEHAVLAACTSPEATTTTAEDVVRAPVEEVNETAHGPTRCDADDVTHATELEAALLAISSPACEAHIEDAGAAETGLPPAAAADAEV